MQINSFNRAITCISAFVLLSGCAQNVPLSSSFWKDHKQRVTVALATPAKPSLLQDGSVGFLDYAINSVVNKNIENYLANVDLGWYRNFKGVYIQRLSRRHIHADAYSGYIDSNPRNYPAYAQQLKGGKLLIIELNAIGASRSYYGFIPLGAPQAYCAMTGELIDLKTKAILWRFHTATSLDIPGKWDQPPNYPNFTATLKKAVNITTQQLLSSFFGKAKPSKPS